MFAPFRSRRTNYQPRACPVLARARQRLHLEALDDRLCPSGGYLAVGSFANNGVLRYQENTGAFIDRLDLHNLGDLKNPVGGVFGPDGNLYVSSGLFGGSPPAVLQYDGTTGEFLRVFASQNLTSPRGILFGPDGNLYVADGNDDASGDPASVERFDGKTGAFLDYFVAPSSGGLTHPSYMVFGPDGRGDGKFDLYVAAAAERESTSPHIGEILRYDGTTGASLGTFVPPNSGGLNSPQGMLFGPDGSLYVANGNWWAAPEVFYKGAYPAGAILKFQGPSGANPGAFQGTFIAGGSGGLANPAGMVFGPDASGDGRPDLYVANSALKDGVVPIAGTSGVLCYDAVSGSFLRTLVAPSGGLKFVTFLTFTETDPTTLNYNAASTLTAISARRSHVALAGDSPQLPPFLHPAIALRSDFGPSNFGLIHAQGFIASLPGPEVRPDLGNTILSDGNAASSGWVVDHASGVGREFTPRGHPGARNRQEQPTAPEQKIGHWHGRDHEANGLLAGSADLTDRNAADVLFARFAEE